MGILSYYRSQEEVSLGCKGSLKMAVCEIAVHPTDPNRLDLIIPGEQHFYVRGATPAERQQWLVALGTAKACLADSRKKNDRGEPPETLRSKMSELRLYCDLLMQRVATVKMAAKSEGTSTNERLNESTSLLSETCDTFIKTLQDCMNIADETFSPQINNSMITDSALPPSLTSDKKKHLYKSHSIDDRYTPPIKNCPGVRTRYRNLEEIASTRPRYQRTHSSPSSGQISPRANENQGHNLSEKQPKSPDSESRVAMNDVAKPNGIHTPTSARNSHSSRTLDFEKTEKIPNFFSSIPCSFSDIKLGADFSIPTDIFLNACVSVVGFFDALNSSAFTPVKMDVNGNIKKLQQKYSTDPVAFDTLQKIVMQEIDNNTTQVKNSATDALMWLRRALSYICEFLTDIKNGQRDLSVAANNAYAKTLKQYHGWVVRGVFALAAKAVPTYGDFIRFVSVDEDDVEKPEYERQLLESVDETVTAMSVVIDVLVDFYNHHDVEVKAVY
ncbi:pleckstrin homology domain-containing family A member 8-like isoform X2 [Anneissia japonica]|uniref:pleckstrin homology domain-containing family A member 8-like isoform X2 n=1 Tax=Anneissia japonica TaxID=1529436 RepID=UPI001425A4F4|nr:pleckstrin homology domain-containing family A member 8-like isoform X2 [Anneissia japonica]